MTKNIRICAIAALGEGNRVIGKNGGLPWHVPEDMRHFMRMTKGKPVIMGRRTFGSLDAPLPGRENIVVSRVVPRDRAPNVRHATTLDSALALATKIAQETGANEIMIAGGARIYEEALPRADRLYLTIIKGIHEGDAFFPAYDEKDWIVVERRETGPCTYLTLERNIS